MTSSMNHVRLQAIDHDVRHVYSFCNSPVGSSTVVSAKATDTLRSLLGKIAEETSVVRLWRR